jgi:hypothetical protein
VALVTLLSFKSTIGQIFSTHMGFGDVGTGIILVGLVLTSGMFAKHHPTITQPSLPTTNDDDSIDQELMKYGRVQLTRYIIYYISTVPVFQLPSEYPRKILSAFAPMHFMHAPL